MPDPAEQIAVLCRELEGGDMRGIVAEIGAEAVLDRILAALASGTAVFDADLDDLDDRLVAYGIPGGLVPPRWRNYAPSPAAAGSMHPAIEVWACPTARCTRWLAIDPTADDPPMCTAQGKPLIKKRLGQ